jgi:hypothetical protein
MNLPDPPIAHKGFFATHFFTVSDQDKSKAFYVRTLGGKGRTIDSHNGHLSISRRAGLRVSSDLATATPLPLS